MDGVMIFCCVRAAWGAATRAWGVKKKVYELGIYLPGGALKMEDRKTGNWMTGKSRTDQ